MPSAMARKMKATASTPPATAAAVSLHVLEDTSNPLELTVLWLQTAVTVAPATRVNVKPMTMPMLERGM